MSETNQIEKKLFMRAPRSRVWKAVSDAKQFGTWFRVSTTGEFQPGARVSGKIGEPGYEHLTWEIVVEKMEPERLFSFRWHPYAIDPAVDYSKEPTTLVTFELADADGGTMVTITESGFDQIPPGRRPTALRMNDEGWGIQIERLHAHVTA